MNAIRTVIVSFLSFTQACTGNSPLAKTTNLSPEVQKVKHRTRKSDSARPPQFVLLAFDGSLNNAFWEESLDFAKTSNVKFSYFVSGVHFLSNSSRMLYREPRHGVGRSNIGWGGTNPGALTRRMEYVSRAHREGHEIGSHANGHFDGSTYSYDEWRLEFSQFPKLLFDSFKNNQITQPSGFDLGFGRNEIKGFRAPVLGQNAAMYEALRDFEFDYDTSKTSAPDQWPTQSGGIWNYPLARLRIAGTAKSTLSMDYNFFVSQSRAKEEKNPALQAAYGKQMLQTYLGYFENNYRGNRAPVHIGHHFSKWNGGTYWRAMKDFARTVCGLPEVKCVTYRELTEFLESLTPAERTDYQRGIFPNSGGTPLAHLSSHSAALIVDANLSLTERNSLKLDLTGKDAAQLGNDSAAKTEWELDGVRVGRGHSLPITDFADRLESGSELSVAVRMGESEILRTTRKISIDPDGKVKIDDHDAESRALQGDLAEAHD